MTRLVQFMHLSIKYMQHPCKGSRVFHFFLSPPVFFSSTLQSVQSSPVPFLPVITSDSSCCFITTISELSAGLLIIAIQPPNPLRVLSLLPLLPPPLVLSSSLLVL